MQYVLTTVIVGHQIQQCQMGLSRIMSQDQCNMFITQVQKLYTPSQGGYVLTPICLLIGWLFVCKTRYLEK